MNRLQGASRTLSMQSSKAPAHVFGLVYVVNLRSRRTYRHRFRYLRRQPSIYRVVSKVIGQGRQEYEERAPTEAQTQPRTHKRAAEQAHTPVARSEISYIRLVTRTPKPAQWIRTTNQERAKNTE